ncbi:MAG: substrate-binding domain-containing protein [Adhaeribacter sp.]
MINHLHARLTYLRVLLLLAGIIFTTACNRSDSTGQSGEAAGEKLRIAVIPKGTTHLFWKSVHAGAAKAGQELGVEIIWQGPQKEDDRQLQIQVVQNFVSREVDGIVLAPLDERSLVPPVKAARNRKIPVVIFDSDLASKDYESFVATDNYAGGKLAAQRMAEVLQGKGNVIVLRYAEGSASTTARENGFMEGLKEYAPQVKIISSNQYAGATMEKAYQASQNILNRFSEVDGIFCANESSTQGMYRALQTSGKAGKVKLIGFDANETLLKAMQDGHLNGLAVQDPFRMGYEGVKTAVAVIQKKPYEKRLDTGVVMITKENMDSPENEELLNPDLDKWLEE